ncbi:MAG: hypothetical protein E3K32_03045 [wastewater metagenome]|nr:hypothetical protein [Candidatus Loosdrechtia aerotolerans]
MEELILSHIPEEVKKIIEPFFLDILSHCKGDVVSLYITGSAVTRDFREKYSDINTVIIVKEIKVPLFDFISTLGKHYSKKRVCAPLILTPDYIHRSLQEFPLEFLEMKLVHQLVYGDNILQDVKLKKADIRLQCERELKGRLQNLCQGYIKAMGDKRILTDLFVGPVSGYFPVFHGILFLYDHKTLEAKSDVLCALEKYLSVDTSVFTRLLEIKSSNSHPSLDALKEIFKDLYHVIDDIARKVDEFKVDHE